MSTVRSHRSIAEIPAAAWNALLPDAHPFVSHEFLHALERTGCIRRELGWTPHHVTLWEAGALVAAAPCYLKANSHGEFVFDHAWAELHQRTGREYYPKLLCAVPYSPVSGPRLLVGAGGDARRDELAAAMLETARRAKCSSLHVNFVRADDAAALARAGLFARLDCQFHWRNDGYGDFDDYLAALNAKRRKEIRRERARLRQHGWQHQWLGGDELDEARLELVYRAYVHTFAEKGNYPALTAAFFADLARALGPRVQVNLASRGGHTRAMAFCLRDDRTLYGRYWGAEEYVPGLHLESCFYQGIGYCIAHGLERFEPGAQGEHKIARGFLPVRTCSTHAIFDRTLEPAIRASAQREAAWLDRYEASVLAHSPFARRG